MEQENNITTTVTEDKTSNALSSKGIKHNLIKLIKSKNFKKIALLTTVVVLGIIVFAFLYNSTPKEETKSEDLNSESNIYNSISYPTSFNSLTSYTARPSSLASYSTSIPTSFPYFELKESKVNKLSECESEYVNGNFASLRFKFNSCEIAFENEEITTFREARGIEYSEVPYKTSLEFRDVMGNKILVEYYLDLNQICYTVERCFSREPVPVKVADGITRQKTSSDKLNTQYTYYYKNMHSFKGDADYERLKQQTLSAEKHSITSYPYDDYFYCTSKLDCNSGSLSPQSGIVLEKITRNHYFEFTYDVPGSLEVSVFDNSGDLSLADKFAISLQSLDKGSN